ncbi:hypothetical protein J1N35_022094, partial [Gossypium stocksii]
MSKNNTKGKGITIFIPGNHDTSNGLKGWRSPFNALKKTRKFETYLRIAIFSSRYRDIDVDIVMGTKLDKRVVFVHPVHQSPKARVGAIL